MASFDEEPLAKEKSDKPDGINGVGVVVAPKAEEGKRVLHVLIILSDSLEAGTAVAEEASFALAGDGGSMSFSWCLKLCLVLA